MHFTLKLGGEFALLSDGGHDGPATLFEVFQIDQPGVKIAQYCVIEAAGRFFAVAGDERDGRPVVNQFNNRCHLLGTYTQLQSQLRDDSGLRLERGDRFGKNRNAHWATHLISFNKRRILPQSRGTLHSGGMIRRGFWCV